MSVKLFDKNGRLFGKISVIDILVIVIVIVLGFAVYSRFFTKETTAVATVNDNFEYQICVKGVRQLTADALRVGDRLYDSEHDTYLGTITAVEVKDSYGEYATLDGEYVVAPIENRVDVILTLSAEGLVSAGRYYASRTYELGVNSSLTFYTKYCCTTGYVWSVG